MTMKTKLTLKELNFLSNLISTNFDCDDEDFEKSQEKIWIKLMKMIGELK